MLENFENHRQKMKYWLQYSGNFMNSNHVELLTHTLKVLYKGPKKIIKSRQVNNFQMKVIG
jgi:hypothetical protein